MAKILLVDDDDAFRSAATRLIESLGHEVRAARGAREAYAALAAGPVDLVLLDVYMPDEDGLEIIRRLSAEVPDLRVVTITGGGALTPEITLTLAKRLGALDALPKPFTRDELAATIDRVLARPPAPERRP